MRFRTDLVVTAATAALVLGLAAASLSCEESPLTAGEDSQIFVTANPANVSIDPEGPPPVEATSNIQAQLFDEGGFPASGVEISFTADYGTLESETATTDGSGTARTRLTLDEGAPGEVDVIARSGTISGTVTITVDVVGANSLPTSSISPSPSSCPLTGQQVTFDSTITDADTPDDPVTCYCWSIDSTVDASDETIAQPNADSVMKNYTQDQTLTVRLRASDDPAVSCATGCLNNPSQFGPFSPALTYRVDRSAPTAAAGPDQSVTLTSGNTVTVPLNGGGSSDPHSGVTTYQWQCGNGTSVNGQSTACAYTVAGIYTVQLTVTNGCGLTASDTLQVTVNP
jgi:hypothetical protein